MVLTLAVAWWVFFGGGLVLLSDLDCVPLAGRGESAPAPAASAPVPQALGYDVSLALQQLKAADSRAYRKLANASNPRLSTTNGLPTYTWDYVEKSSSNSVSIHEIAITLDQAGQIVRVSGQ